MGPNKEVAIIDKKGSVAQTPAQFLLFDRKRVEKHKFPVRVLTCWLEVCASDSRKYTTFIYLPLTAIR